MLKQFFVIVVSLLLITWLETENTHADTARTSIKNIQYSPSPSIDIDHRPDTEDIVRTSFNNIEPKFCK